MKDPKKVEAGKRLAAINCKKREAKKIEEQAQLGRGFTLEMNQYYGFGAILALGVIGGLHYYIYHTKKEEQPSNPQQNNPKPCPQVIAEQVPSGMQPAQSNKFDMD